MRNFLFIIAAFSFVFSSCKKSSDANVAENYLPTTVGSNWTYKVTTAGTAVTTVKYTVSNRDTVANARTYAVLTGSNGSSLYNAKTGSDYFTFRAVAGQGLELLYLKDDKDINGTWNTSQTLTGLTGLPGGITSANINIAYIVKEKGTTRTVSGTSYTNVVKVEATLSAAVAILTLPLGTAEFYFSKNIGLIESKILINNATLGFNIDEKYELQSYEIK
jgi:hypothetical protein